MGVGRGQAAGDADGVGGGFWRLSGPSQKPPDHNWVDVRGWRNKCKEINKFEFITFPFQFIANFTLVVGPVGTEALSEWVDLHSQPVEASKFNDPNRE